MALKGDQKETNQLRELVPNCQKHPEGLSFLKNPFFKEPPATHKKTFPLTPGFHFFTTQDGLKPSPFGRNEPPLILSLLLGGQKVEPCLTRQEKGAPSKHHTPISPFWLTQAQAPQSLTARSSPDPGIGSSSAGSLAPPHLSLLFLKGSLPFLLISLFCLRAFPETNNHLLGIELVGVAE